MILVVCAVASELATFAPRDHVEVLVGGVGPVEAAIATSRALAQSRYRLVVNAGIGGAFAGRAEVGDVVFVAHDRFVDLRREDGTKLDLPGVPLVDTVDADPRVLDLYTTGRLEAIVGGAITSASVTTSAERAQTLANRYGATVESMEGYAVMRAAEIAGVPAIALRGISNIVGAERASWNIDAGRFAAVAALGALFAVLDPAA